MTANRASDREGYWPMLSPCWMSYLMRGETRRLRRSRWPLVGRGSANADFGGGVSGSAKSLKSGWVVTEFVGLEYAYFSLLIGLVVSSAWDAQDAGQVGRAVDVPATIAAGVLEDHLQFRSDRANSAAFLQAERRRLQYKDKMWTFRLCVLRFVMSGATVFVILNKLSRDRT